MNLYGKRLAAEGSLGVLNWVTLNLQLISKIHRNLPMG